MFAVWYCVFLPISVPACTHQMWWCAQTSQQVPNHFAYCLTTLMKNLVNFRKGEKLFPFPVQVDFDVSLPLPSFLGISLHSNHLSHWAWILVVHHSFPECPAVMGCLGVWLCPWEGASPSSTWMTAHLVACPARRMQKLPVGFADHMRPFPQNPVCRCVWGKGYW